MLRGRGTAVKSMLRSAGHREHGKKRILLDRRQHRKRPQAFLQSSQKISCLSAYRAMGSSLPSRSKAWEEEKPWHYLNNGQPAASSYTPELSCSVMSSIIAIANEGRTDLVMNAARAAGATGRHRPPRKGHRLQRTRRKVL